MLQTLNLLAQVQTGYEQTEYIAAIGLTVAMIILGLVAVCVPRPRDRHFVEPEEEEEDSKKGAKKKRKKKR